MKTPEQKYNEALERAKKLQKTCDSTAVIGWCEYIFPELKESEDERIRKELLNAFQESEDSLYMVLTPHRRESFIAWLEKQGTSYTKKDFDDAYLKGVCDAKKELEKQGEQKHIISDKAKEMFIKALERVEELNTKGYKLTDCDKNFWWEDFKTYTSYTIEQKPIGQLPPPEEG